MLKYHINLNCEITTVKDVEEELICLFIATFSISRLMKIAYRG